MVFMFSPAKKVTCHC